MNASFRKSRLLIATALLAVASTVAVSAPAIAAPNTTTPASGTVPYAALGDSYAAGVGGGGYLDQCLRSPAGYPARLVGVARIQLVDDPACSGAATGDVIAMQVPTVPATTQLVTLTVGGNDVGFLDTMVACFVYQDPVLCPQAIAAGETVIASGVLSARVAATVAAIRAQAPGAKILVTGYPVLFALPSRYAAAAQVDQGVLALDAAIQAGATAAGATYVDVTGAFAGHGIGSAAPWIIDFSPAAGNMDAFHPNAAGYKAYANALKPALG